MNDWQPIESAPKDGKTAILYACNMYVGVCYIGVDCVLRDPDDDHALWFQKPTHWMPLPAPPASPPRPMNEGR